MPIKIYHSDAYHPDAKMQASCSPSAFYSFSGNSDSYGYCPIYRDTRYSYDRTDGDVSNISLSKRASQKTSTE